MVSLPNTMPGPSKKQIMADLRAARAQIAALTAREPIQQPSDAARRIHHACRDKPLQECFVAILMNSRSRVLHVEVCAIGTVSEVSVHPRDIFRAAVQFSAHHIVIGHSHPSGDPTPSEADRSLTHRLVAAGEVLGIPVVDHVIVTSDICKIYSFAARGEI